MPIQQMLLGTGPSAATGFVTDNLVFHLDAADTNCYSGSGTTVNSLVNSHTSEHWGDMEWDGDSGGNTGGYFYVDGTQASGLQFPYSTDFEETGYDSGGSTVTIDDYSYEWWWYGNDASSVTSVEIAFHYAWVVPSPSAGRVGSNLGQARGFFNIYRIQGPQHGHTLAMYRGGKSPTIKTFTQGTWTGNKWIHFVVTRSGSTVKLYEDSGTPQSVTQTPVSLSTTNQTDKRFMIFPPYLTNSGWKLTGRLGIMRLYQGKTLTASEVQQNYNAEKSRYGH